MATNEKDWIIIFPSLVAHMRPRKSHNKPTAMLITAKLASEFLSEICSYNQLKADMQPMGQNMDAHVQQISV